MDANTEVFDLAQAAGADRARVGGKARVLGELVAAGFAVPPGLVVTAAAVDIDGWETFMEAAARSLGAQRFAVRSSGAAEDLPDASYAGLYETYLNVPVEGLREAVRRCFAASTSERVSAYHHRNGGGTAGMAVLVQAMVDPMAAGVAFTAHPVTGGRDQVVLIAVPGFGDPLVSGEAVGEEWAITTREAQLSRPMPGGEVLAAGQAQAVADLAREVAERYGQPQDVEWAIDQDGRLWLLQARPMTALPELVLWTAPGPGLWMRNFRLGERLPEAVTPLFATWLLPMLEDGYLDGMHESVGVRVPFRYALVNSWYYNATPIPSPKLLASSVVAGARPRGEDHLQRADPGQPGPSRRRPRRAVRSLTASGERSTCPPTGGSSPTPGSRPSTAAPDRLSQLIDQLGREAGIYLWYLAIVGGSAWKMEACLTRFYRQHLAQVLPDEHGGAQVLLRGLPGTQPVSTGHAVQSADWYHPVAAELSTADMALADGGRPARTASSAARHGGASVPGRPRRSTTAADPVRAAAAGQPAVCGHPRGTGPRLHPRLAGPAHLCPPARRAPGRDRRGRAGRRRVLLHPQRSGHSSSWQG